MTMGVVEHIHVSAEAGGPMQSLEEASAVRGSGLAGDRYANGKGYWSDARVSRDLTLIESEVVEELSREHGVTLAPGGTRRNVTTKGVRLNDLVGRHFWIGDVLCAGTGLCEPCRHLEQLTGQRLLRPMIHRGGLRADVLTRGVIRTGDSMDPVDEAPGVGVVVVRDERVLLGRRLAAHGRGTWSTPGGKPVEGETVVACAIRELCEETSLEAGSLRIVAETLDGFPDSRLVYRTRFVEVDRLEGEPRVREPDKTESWSWHGWDDLPQPLFAPVASLVATGYRPTVTGHHQAPIRPARKSRCR